MTNVNKTLYIPLYGKAQVSKKNIILHDKMAEKIWSNEAFQITGKAKSKWLAYFMSMRARVFDDWVDNMLKQNKDTLVLHIGCGLDSRFLRVKENYTNWIDADLPEVIVQRKKYFEETINYHMETVDATRSDSIMKLSHSSDVIVILEGISMYLTNNELKSLLFMIQNKYRNVHLLMDVYTELGAKASKYRNPINEVGVTEVYGVSDIEELISGTKLKLRAEHSLTPDTLIEELKGFDKIFFKTLFAGKIANKLYRLYELENL